MSDPSSFLSCLFCLKKTSSLKNKLTSDVLKDLNLFQFFCKYLLHQNDFNNSIHFNFDSIEDGMLPVCTKCANRYKELAELYSEFKELETQIKSVVEEFREFVFSSSSDYDDDQQNNSDFHRNFRQRVLQQGNNPDMMDIKEELIVPDELEMENITAMTMDADYQTEPIEQNFDYLSEENFVETQQDDLDQMDQKEEKVKSESEIIEPRRSLRSRDVPLVIMKEEPELKPAKKRAKVTPKKVKRELDSDSSYSDYISTPKTVKKKEKVVRKKLKTKPIKVKVTQPKKIRMETKKEPAEPKRYICSLAACGMELDTRKRLYTHLLKHETTTPEEEKTLSCTFCQKIFAVERNLNHHVSLHKLQENKDKKSFICLECDTHCYNQERLDKHISDVHQKDVVKFVCTICGKKFKNRWAFNIHLKLHAGIKPRIPKLQCKSCPEVFSSSNRLKKHAFLKHPDSSNVFHCTVCGKKYYHKSFLQTHLLTHSEEKIHECKMCPEKFKTARGLDAHAIRNHGKDPHTCTICEKKFSSITGINTHNRLHHDQSKNWYSHECTMCDKKFHSRTVLERHLLYHGDARDFICDVCGKGFKTKDTLHNHMNCHKDDANKRYKCDICNKAFSWYPSHKSHMKSHHGIDIGPVRKNPKPSTSTATKSKSTPDSALTLAENSAVSLNPNLYVPNLPVEFPIMYSNPYPFNLSNY